MATLWTLVVGGGCTALREYAGNGFKVGPNYCAPSAPVAERWIDDVDVRTANGEDLSRWWQVFNDSALERLVQNACRQNLSLREAGCRVLAARAERGIVMGELFPQRQAAAGSYLHESVSRTTANAGPGSRFFDQWNMGFSLGWELDFWGRFRRAVAAADARLDASVEAYDDVLVTLLGDVAGNYVQVRTLQERIALLEFNAAVERLVLDWTIRRWKGGKSLALDVHQMESTVEQTESRIPELAILLRHAENRLCILLGMPPVDLQDILGQDRIPTAPADVVLGIPAELLRRRPDVRRAERLAAAQAEQIGIAQADFYPALSINGTLGWQSEDLTKLFSSRSLSSSVGPAFQWNILNYGRIINNVRLQDARFQELVAAYQQTVLQAGEEAENGMVTFLQARHRAEHLDRGARAARAAVVDMFDVIQKGRAGFDFNRFALIEQNRVQQDDLLAQSRGAIAQGLIEVYRALGGGWQIRLDNWPPSPLEPATVPTIAPVGSEELQKLRQLLAPEDMPGGEDRAPPVPGPR